MSISTNKKIVIVRFEREPVNGFVNPQNYLSSAGIEVLSQAGALLQIPYAEVKLACFVRDFDTSGVRTDARVFNTRPKMNGLWVRMRFRDGEVMDGLLPNNLLQLEQFGFTVVPPNPTSSNQKFFVPRAALEELQVLGVVGSPLKPQKAKGKPKEQIELFE